MAANALRVLLLPLNPNPNVRRPSLGVPTDRAATACRLRPPRLQLLPCRRRGSLAYVARAADGGESDRSDINVQNTNNKLELDDNDLVKALKQALETLEQAKKRQSDSLEEYTVYLTKTMAIFVKYLKNMTIQLDKANHHLAELTREIGEEGRDYIAAATENSPDAVKDIVEVLVSPPDVLEDISKVHDFHVGIPYGALLIIMGFTSFMFTGSTSAIRFGIILGGVLFALGAESLRLWKLGKTSSLLLKSQTAVASIIFIRQWRLLSQSCSLLSAAMTFFSGAVVVFYIYRIIVNRQGKRPGLDHGSDD